MNQVYRHTYVRNPQFGFPSIGLIPQSEPALEHPPLSVMVTMVTASQLDGRQSPVEPKANNPPQPCFVLQINTISYHLRSLKTRPSSFWIQ